MRKFYLLFMLALVCAVGAWADGVATVDGIQTGGIYTIKSTRNAITWNGTDANCVGAALDASNPNHQFVAIKTAGYDDRFYLYNVGAGKFMGKSSNNASLTDGCEVYWKVKASGDAAWPLMIDAQDGNHFNFGGSGQITIDSWSTADAGNKLQITEVSAADETLLATIQGKIVARVQQEYNTWKATITVGSKFGQYTADSEALATAESALAAAADEAAALAAKQQCMDAYKLNGPVVGSYYRIKNTAQGLYLGIDGYTLNMKHKAVTDATTGDNDPSLVWKYEQDGDKYYMKNVYSGLYPQYIPGGSDATAKAGTGKDNAFTCAVHVSPTDTEDAQWNIFFGGRQVNCEGSAAYLGNVNYWFGENAHYYIYEVEAPEDGFASMCTDWYKANPKEDATVPAKIDLDENATVVIAPTEFAAPSVINGLIDNINLSADDATQESIYKMYETLSSWSLVLAYESAIESYGSLLSTSYTTDADSEWGTIILPVNWTQPEGWTRYTCAATDGNVLTLVENADGVNKNTPYIIKVAEAQRGVTYQFIGYSTGAETTNQTIGLLTGVLEDGAKVPAGSYALAKNNGHSGFFRVAEGADCDAAKNKCYLTLPAGAAQYAALYFESGIDTGIDSTLGTEAKPGNGVIYNMAGQRLNRMQKGLNIVNGKVVLK